MIWFAEETSKETPYLQRKEKSNEHWNSRSMVTALCTVFNGSYFFGRSFLEELFLPSQKNRMVVIIVWPRKFVDDDTGA